MTDNFQNGARDSLKESLSALMDDQASEMELHRVLKATENNEELRSAWSRYQLIGAAMRGEASASTVDLSGAISAAIAEEPIPKAETDDDASSWWQRASRVAIAASVAGVVVVVSQFADLNGAQPLGQQVAQQSDIRGGDAEQAAPGVVPAMSLPAGFRAPDLAARTVSSHKTMPAQQPSQTLVKRAVNPEAVVNQKPTPEVQAYLQHVMTMHTDNNASFNSGSGVLSYARIPPDSQ